MPGSPGSTESKSGLCPIVEAILRTVAYADVFDYPLTLDQIHRYLVGAAALPSVVRSALCSKWLVPQQLTRTNGYYCLSGREDIVQTRLRRAERAAVLWPKAQRYALAIATLPFVRMVAITGALTMENVDADADIDFLIVTAPRRVWLARSLSIALVYRGRLERTDICPNYVISIDALDQFDRSFFSAHELAQMVPLYGLDVYERLIRRNRWVTTYLPNAFGSDTNRSSTFEMQHQQAPSTRESTVRHRLKRGAERILQGGLGDFWERYQSTQKIRQLSAEAACAESDAAAFTLQRCKGHMADHGRRIQQAYAQRLYRLGITLPEMWKHRSTPSSG